jgi:hypothetical protein
MKEHKVKVVVLQDGRVVVENVPVKIGTTVEVTVRVEEPVKYHDPFGAAIDPTEWDAEK